MGFCRRCGDILNTEKCNKCGGTAVAGVVKMGSGTPGTPRKEDRWEKKYTERRSASPSPIALKPLDGNLAMNNSPSSSPKRGRFPRPMSVVDLPSSFTPITPPSPNFPTFETTCDPAKAQSDSDFPIIPLDDGLTLARIHGTVLSPPPALRCAHCIKPFPPTAVLYPTDSPDTFACRTCWQSHGGSLGPCASCGTAVLRLCTEGKWVQVRDRVWHARCFACRGCGKGMSDCPIVGIEGEPECEACFGKVGKNVGGGARKNVGEREKRNTVRAIAELQGVLGQSPSPKEVIAQPASMEPSAPSIAAVPAAAHICPTCSLPLVPPPGQTTALVSAASKQYHAACFSCVICRGSFSEKEGTAVFVLCEGGAAHLHCTPTTPTKAPSSPTRPISIPTLKSARFPQPLSPLKTSSPFPTGAARPPSPLKPPPSPTQPNAVQCPACLHAVSPMERGTVPGPGGGRWHAGCLKCGGGRAEDEGLHKDKGCGKKLDSGAKEAGGRVWCRGCWDNLPSNVRPSSPTRASLLIPMHTGLRSPTKLNGGLTHAIFPRAHQRAESLGLIPQVTGCGLPITRQLTGTAIGGSAGIARQVTGAGYGTSTGQVASLVRQMTGNGVTTRRPRSVHGTQWLTKLENVNED